MTKCLVLGGGGFLGSHLTDALLAQGHAVTVFDRPNLIRYRTFSSHEDVIWYEGDFADSEHIAQVVAGCEVIYHLVSTTLPKSSNENPIYDVETNIVGTLHLLDAALKNGTRKVIFVSSGGTVYGIPQKIPIKENHPTDPVCSYGIVKLAIEKYLHLFHTIHGLNYCVLRLANPYGERQRIAATQGAVTVFLDKALRGEEIAIWGDGSVVRDYFYVSDAVSALIQALDYDGSQRIFNIGSGFGHSLNEIIQTIESVLNISVRKTYMPSRAFDVPINVLDINQANDLLNWRPQVRLQEGLSRTARWLQSS